jgi:putative oxidoreductase
MYDVVSFRGATSSAMSILFPQLLRFNDIGLLLLRLMAGGVFFDSGLRHVKDPVGRAKTIDASPRFTLFLGIAELAGGAGLAVGLLTQLAALGLMLLGLGAMVKKIFVWKTGFWGEKGYGWHYDLLLFVMNLEILITGGGRWVLF